MSAGAFDFVMGTPGLLVYVKNWGKAVHPIIVANLQYRIVKRLMEQGQLSLAKKIEGGKHGSKCSTGSKTGTGGDAPGNETGKQSRPHEEDRR